MIDFEVSTMIYHGGIVVRKGNIKYDDYYQGIYRDIHA